MAFDALNAIKKTDQAMLKNPLEGLFEQIVYSGQGWDEMNKKAEVHRTLWDKIGDSAGRTWGKISDAGGKAWGHIANAGERVWTAISDTMGGLWAGFSETAGNVWAGIKETGGNVWGTLTEWGGGLWKSIKEFGEEAWKAIKAVFDAVLGPIVDTVKGLIDGAKGLIGGVTGKVGDLWAGFKQTVGLEKRPEQAQAEKMVQEAQVQQQQLNANITLSVDGRALAQAAIDDLLAEAKRQGVSI
jgi:hypothetical protein